MSSKACPGPETVYLQWAKMQSLHLKLDICMLTASNVLVCRVCCL